MPSSYAHAERRCECCGESFWGKRPRARYCSNACRQRTYRAKQPYGLGASDLPALCARVLSSVRDDGRPSPRKLLPRLFRAAARELRMQGWDPIELLLAKPDDPLSDDDAAPGGIEGAAPNRRRWLYPPEVELAKIEAQIVQRRLEGGGVGWYERRRAQLTRLLDARKAQVSP